MAISHRTNRLKLIGTPAVEQLQNGRYQLTINCSTMNSRKDWYSENKARIFPDFGSLESAEMSIDGLAPRTGEAYTDMRLVSVQSSTQGELYVVTLLYQTLGSSFVQVKDDTFNFGQNGLRRVTRTSIAKAGTDFQKTVGTTSITSQIDTETAVTCFLASYEIDDTDSYREVTEVYIEAGTLSETEDKVGSQLAIVKETFASTPSTPAGYSLASQQISDFSGIPTRQFRFLKPSVLSRNISTRNKGKLIIETVEAFNETPTANTSGAVQIGDQESNVEGIPTKRFTFAKGEGEVRTSTRPGRIDGTTEVTAVSYGTEVVPTGVLISKSETQEDGYSQFTNTCIQGTIEGTKTTYKDVVQVEVPGEVQCTTISVSSGGESGNIAVPKVTPRRRKTIAAQVTIDVQSTPPDTASVAFDLGAISCSVTSTNVSLTRGAGNTVSVSSGSTTSSLTGFSQNFGASARIQTYPGCFLTSSSSSGSISYITSETPRANGNVIVTDTNNSSRNTICEGTGSTTAEGYSTTGIIKRNSRPIITALDGTTYYEVITWSV
tara:strand:+ start:34 stop:1680 length:1647 start_codon:yes stop_codon:yes gene_type:complete